MKIVIDARFIAGGAVTHLYGVLSCLDPDNEYQIFANDHVASQICKMNLPVELVIFNGRSFFHKVIWYAFVRTIYVMHINGELLICLSSLNVFSPCKTVCVFQNMLPFDDNALSLYSLPARFKFNIFKFFYLLAFYQSDKVICLSRYAMDVLKKNRVNVAKMFHVGHGFDDNIIEVKKKWVPGKKILKLVYVSNWHPYKNIDFLFGSYANLPSDKSIQIDLIGGGDPQTINYLQSKLNDFRHESVTIRYLGKVENSELKDRLASGYDCGIFSSVCENSPNIVIEYISCRLPVLYSSYPSVDELISNNTLNFCPDNASFTDAVRKSFELSNDDHNSIIQHNLKGLTNKSWEKTAACFWRYIKNGQ